MKEVIDEQVQLMLKQGVIEASHSNFSSNVVIVRKPLGKFRFTVNSQPYTLPQKKCKLNVPIFHSAPGVPTLI